MYKISIIVPVFNVEEFLDTAIQSLLNQTIGFENLQVIFVDDGSTDNSKKIIEAYSTQYANVIFLSTDKNSGAAGKPRNVALKEARAKYIMFLDPDDYYSEDGCEILFNEIEKSGADLVSGYYSKIDMENNILSSISKEYECLDISIIDLSEKLSVALSLRNSFWSKIYRNDIIQKNNISFPEKIPGQDMVFICDYLLCSNKFAYINKPVYFYRERSSGNKSISYKNSYVFFEGINECYKLCYKIFARKQKTNLFQFVIKDVYEFYILKMLDSDELSDNEIKLIFQEWQWIYNYYFEAKLVISSEYASILIEYLLLGDFEKALDIFNKLKLIRRYVMDLEWSIMWKDEQIRSLQLNVTEMRYQLTDLTVWNKELENAKHWLLEQADIKEEWFRQQIITKDTEINLLNEKIDELERWTQELTEAKAWFEEQVQKNIHQKE